MDPNENIYSIINVSKLPSSVVKRLVLEYTYFLKQGKEFKVVFFLDELFDNAILENYKEYFTRLSYDEDSKLKIKSFSKNFFQNTISNYYYLIFIATQIKLC